MKNTHVVRGAEPPPDSIHEELLDDEDGEGEGASESILAEYTAEFPPFLLAVLQALDREQELAIETLRRIACVVGSAVDVLADPPTELTGEDRE